MSFSNEIITIIDELAKRFGIVIDWTAENVMPYMTDLGNRFVGYTMTMSIISLVIKFTILFIGLFITYKVIKFAINQPEEKLTDDNTVVIAIFAVLGIVITAIAILVLAFTGYNNVKTIVACNYIPEKIIFDYIKTLL